MTMLAPSRPARASLRIRPNVCRDWRRSLPATAARVFAILDPQGTVVADSVSPFYSVPNQLKQPEVQDALNGAEPSPSASKVRINSQSGHRALFAAAPIQLADRVLGIVQISRPVSAVVATIRPLLVSLAVAGLLALVVATLLGIGLSRRLASPVHRLEEAALAMAGGDLQQHVPVETPDELGELAIAFNVMARRGTQVFCPTASVRRQRQPRAAHAAD